MGCKNFQANLDRYVDGELAPTEMRSAAEHAAMCKSCDLLVTSSQQLHVLLTTAVTDRVVAVDVSGLWESIEVELDKDPGPGFAESSVPSKIPSIWQRFGERLGALVGDGLFIPTRVGVLATAAAVVALMVFLPETDTETPRVGPAPSASSANIVSASSIIWAAPVPARDWPVRIDSMEVAEGRNVTTWMRPKTKTRVIWVGDSSSADDLDTEGFDADGFGVNNLSLER